MTKLKIGMIGCGFMMNVHADAFAKMEGVDIVAVVDPVKEQREKLSARFPGSRAYKDHNDFYNGEKNLDAVIVAVPPAEHKGLEEEAISRKWNFFVEKPMTLDPILAKKIAADSKKAGIVTSVGFQDRYMDITDRMKEELKTMDVGLIHATWAGGTPGVDWWRRKTTCGGQHIEQTIHLIDMVRYLFGEYESVYAEKTKGIIKDEDFPGYDIEDSSSLLFRLKCGATATIFSACYLISGSVADSGITALGRQKTLVYSLRKDLHVVSNESDLCYKLQNDQLYDADLAFIEAVRKGDPTGVRSPYSDALISLEACFAADESLKTGKVVKL